MVTSASHFKNKTRTILSEKPTRFNGLTILLSNSGSITIDKREKIERLQPEVGQKIFEIMRVLSHYVGINVRLTIFALVQLITAGSFQENPE